MKAFTRFSAALALALVGAAVKAQGSQAFTLQISSYKQSVAERLGDDEDIAAFYRARGFEPIWTGGSEADLARREALLEAFGMADDHGLPRGRYDAQDLMGRMALAGTGQERGQLEVELTRTFLRFAHDLQTGMLEPGRLIDGIKRKPPRRDAQDLLTRLVQEDPRVVMRSLAPASPEYARLLRAKLKLEHRIAHGGWGPGVQASRLDPGDRGEAVVALRNRLTVMGYMTPSLSSEYDGALEAAVRAFQDDYALEADGIAGPGTLQEVNTAPEARLQSIIVAMERERWLNTPQGLGQRHIRVNLTDFHAQIYDDNKLTYETKSVIGHQDYDRRTPEFSDVMDHMVINPSWYVPRSIIVGEYLPLLRANPGAVRHLEITDARGRIVSRNRSFAGYSAASFPYAMRQPPGPKNALGSVKFMFPNRYNIYLHDTPSQYLFSREVRTFSHGCIRLDDPHDFAYALLAKQETDPVGTFQRILRSGSETRANLDQPVPVHLIYRTAFTEAKGHVKFRKDVYGRDAILWRALEREGVALRAGNS